MKLKLYKEFDFDFDEEKPINKNIDFDDWNDEEYLIDEKSFSIVDLYHSGINTTKLLREWFMQNIKGKNIKIYDSTGKTVYRDKFVKSLSTNNVEKLEILINTNIDDAIITFLDMDNYYGSIYTKDKIEVIPPKRK